MSAWWRLSRREQVQILGWLEVRNTKKDEPRGRSPSREPTPAELAALRARALKHGTP